MMVSFISFVIVIGICVIVHEYGHYITARLLGVQVHEFAFGMGPVLKQIQQNTTKENASQDEPNVSAGPRMLWSWRLFPVGGFCRLAGMGEESDGETVVPGMGFNEQRAWKRFFILLNGSLSNVVLALILTAAFLYGHGVLNMNDTKIGTLMEGFPAQQAGFHEGDRILEVNGKPVSEWREMSNSLREAARLGDVVFTVERDSRVVKIETSIPDSKEHGYPMLGITPGLERYTALGAAQNAAGYIWDMTVLMLRGIWDWITQKQEVDVTGPIGIASMSGRAMREGVWSFVTFLALISLNLGLLNLFPFPALDGGRIVFVLLEMLLRRRLPEKVENWIHTTGFVLLISLMLFVTWQDIYKLFWGE
ncbi:MAG: RIP metalloprotease RseP [Synergistaceae bacterium]|jgi:regulator of sigma E protease|nr:RIP metalloprotease RseP [Synergistaceae bacterium]